MRFNKIKQTYLIGGVAILLLALLSWFLLLAPRIAQASEIGEHTATVEAQNVKAAGQIVALTGLKDGLVHERAVAAALAVKFPPTADEATLFRQIVTAAKMAGIPEKNITSLGPAAPILGAPSSGAKLPGAGAVPASGEAAPAKGAAAAKGAENMAVMAVSFNAQGDFTQMVAMLKNLEDLPRSFLITQVNLSSADKGKFTIAVQGNMYVHRSVPDPEATVAATPTAIVGTAAYCAPLKAADEYDQKHPSQVGSVKVGQLLEPAVAAAAAEGKMDVGVLLSLMTQANSSDGKKLTAEQSKVLVTALVKTSPIILKECGVNMLR